MSLPTVCKWVLDAWKDIRYESVTYSFKKCGISNEMKGTEDDSSEMSQIDEDKETADPWNNFVNFSISLMIAMKSLRNFDAQTV